MAFWYDAYDITNEHPRPVGGAGWGRIVVEGEGGGAQDVLGG
jgi:hypothetical protein